MERLQKRKQKGVAVISKSRDEQSVYCYVIHFVQGSFGVCEVKKAKKGSIQLSVGQWIWRCLDFTTEAMNTQNIHTNHGAHLHAHPCARARTHAQNRKLRAVKKMIRVDERALREIREC